MLGSRGFPWCASQTHFEPLPTNSGGARRKAAERGSMAEREKEEREIERRIEGGPIKSYRAWPPATRLFAAERNARYSLYARSQLARSRSAWRNIPGRRSCLSESKSRERNIRYLSTSVSDSISLAGNNRRMLNLRRRGRVGTLVCEPRIRSREGETFRNR